MSTNFRCYQLARELYKSCETLKAKAYLKDQLNRAALSVFLNLNEGSAKLTAKERMRFYNISYASLREVKALLDVMEQQELFQKADKLGGMIYCLMKSG